ncbi:MAG TPA: ice-binding family protein [Burkholderiales bacterium]
MRVASGPPTAPGAGTGVDGAGHGPAPINLFTAANFVIVAETAITDIPPSAVTGNVGLWPTTGAAVDLTCAEVTGRIYIVDAAGPTCRTRNAGALLNQAVGDGHTAWNDGRVRVPDYTDIGTGTIGNIGGFTLPPATYKWSTGVQIPADLTLSGGPNDVWIFLIEHDLNVSPGVRIILDGGALPQNVFWLTLIDGVEIGAGSQFAGVILAETSIFMRTGASINGRLLAAQSINLDTNTVTQP